MKVLLTGASGFVGGPVCSRLLAAGHRVVVAVRRDDMFLPLGVEVRRVAPLGPGTDWREALEGCQAVVHLAARAHVLNDNTADPLALFRRINRDGAVRLANQAAQAGVRRFVFVSSIKVNGELTPTDRPFRGDDDVRPADPYALSKAEAESELAEIAAHTGLSLAVVRPPLVHGPGVKGNLHRLLQIVHHGLPLPFGAVDNRRSLVGVHNLADAIVFLTDHDAKGCFLVRDGEDVSTAELVRRIAGALACPARLLPVPPALLRAAGALTGTRAAIQRLVGSLVVDDAPLRALGWTPPRGLHEGLAAMAAAYLRTSKKEQRASYD